MRPLTPDPDSKGMTERERKVVNRLHHLVDLGLDPDVEPIVSDGLALIIELIRDRGKRRDFEELYDRPHDEF